MNALQSRWKSLSARDRRLLALWLAGMGVAALAGSWSALHEARERAQALLAAERQTLETMRVQAAELERLKQLPAAGGNVLTVAPGTLADGLAKFGLPPDILPPLAGDNQLSLQGRVPFDKWLEWIAFVQKDTRLVVQKAKVGRAEQPGLVDMQATLEPSGEGP